MWLMCPIKLLQTLQRQLLPVGLWVQIGSVSLLRDSVSRARELRLWPTWPAQSRALFCSAQPEYTRAP